MLKFLLSWITTPQYLWSFMTLLSFISFWIIILLPFTIISSIKQTIEEWEKSKENKDIDLFNSKYKINEKVKWYDAIGIVIDVKFNENLGMVYLVKYEDGSKLWTLEYFLNKVEPSRKEDIYEENNNHIN